MAKANKAKPLSFSTTIRNPERIPKFLKCIAPFEGKILTSQIIHDVIKNIIREKEYMPVYVKRSEELSEIFRSEDEIFNDSQLEEIISHSPQQHKEAGFAHGWDSRFDTWYKMIKEFGFIKYKMDSPIVITATGHILTDAFYEIPQNSIKIQKIFLNALMKYQTNNPLRRNSNENAPLPLLLEVIRLLREDPEENGAGLARHELPILICWKDNNAKSVYECIKAIRKEKGFNCSDEYIHEKCLSILGSNNRKYFKMSQICHEAVDEYIRKMRMSGLISLRGNGRFVDINTFEAAAAEYVIKSYSHYRKYETEEDYTNYMGKIDTVILQLQQEVSISPSDIRKKTLYEYASEKTREFIFDELLTVCNKKESKDNVLRYINAPTRLEFLTSIALVQSFRNLDVNPNYAVDDEGLPVYTASGGMADIECFDTDYDSYFEVTLMCGRNDQVNNEIIPISRHLRDIKAKRRNESFSVLVAPKIHQDTVEAAEWQNIKYNINILTYDILNFIDTLKKNGRVSDMLLMSESE